MCHHMALVLCRLSHDRMEPKTCGSAFERRVQRLQRIADHLRLLSPDATLQRGYSITTTVADGALVTSADAIPPGTRIATRLAQGTLESRTE